MTVACHRMVPNSNLFVLQVLFIHCLLTLTSHTNSGSTIKTSVGSALTFTNSFCFSVFCFFLFLWLLFLVCVGFCLLIAIGNVLDMVKKAYTDMKLPRVVCSNARGFRFWDHTAQLESCM